MYCKPFLSNQANINITKKQIKTFILLPSKNPNYSAPHNLVHVFQLTSEDLILVVVDYRVE